jgi:hypothetical protein
MNNNPNTHRNTTGRRHHRLLAITVVTGCSVAAFGGAALAATEDPPPFDQCRFMDHPAAADLGSLAPSHTELPAEAHAVLHGEVIVGTDCSVYDLPTDQPV